MGRLCEGRVAIVTGAGRGIGREHALSLAYHGAKVVVNDLGGNVDGSGGDLSPAEQVVQEIKGMGGEAIANGDSVSFAGPCVLAYDGEREREVRAGGTARVRVEHHERVRRIGAEAGDLREAVSLRLPQVMDDGACRTQPGHHRGIVRRDGVALNHRRARRWHAGDIDDVLDPDRYAVKRAPIHPGRQFARMLRGELDFARERRNLEEFRRHFAEDAGVLFPEPWAEYSSRRVLTMEFLEGVLISDVAALEGAGFDREDFARRHRR